MIPESRPSDLPGFENQEMEPGRLPDYNLPQLRPVVASFRRYVVISTIVLWAGPVAVAVLAWSLPLLEDLALGIWPVPAVLLLALLTLVYRRLDAGHRGWAMREHDLIAKSGVLWRSVTVLPIARIQHVETSHGPLERFHGIARVKLFTAGGMTADLVLLGLDLETADRLREYLVEQIRLRERREPGDGEFPEPSDPEDWES